MAQVEIRTAVEVNEQRCSGCSICSSLCPFEALKREEGKVVLQVERCQVCGLCYSSCPAKAIDIFYYDLDSLTRYIRQAKQRHDSDTLVIACKGSIQDFNQVEELFGLSKFIPLSVPCVGRVSEEVYLKAIADLDIKKVYVLACDEDFCRFERGSRVSGRRITALNLLLEQFGFGEEVVTLKRNSLRAIYNPAECVGCGKCEFICPYEAVKLQQLATPRIEPEACRGCGACALVCPHLAIEVEGFEYERLSSLIQSYGAKAEQLKAQGTSPAVLVFACQWAVFPPPDRRDGLLGETAFLVEIPCFNKLDPIYVLQAFRSGFDGVLAVVCSDEDCKSGEGRGAAEENMAALRLTLKKLGLDDRFEVYKTSPRYVGDFEAKLKSFLDRISSLKKLEVCHE